MYKIILLGEYVNENESEKWILKSLYQIGAYSKNIEKRITFARMMSSSSFPAFESQTSWWWLLTENTKVKTSSLNTKRN